MRGGGREGMSEGGRERGEGGLVVKREREREEGISKAGKVSM